MTTLQLSTPKYRIPFADEVLEELVEDGGDICCIPPGFETALPLRSNLSSDLSYQSYVVNRGLSFYFRCSKDLPIVAARAGRVVSTKRSYGKVRDKRVHKTNSILLNQGDGTYAQYVHVFPEVEKDRFVNAGERIGVLGGYVETYGPHLHLYVLQRKMGLIPPWPVLRPIEICPQIIFEITIQRCLINLPL